MSRPREIDFGRPLPMTVPEMSADHPEIPANRPRMPIGSVLASGLLTLLVSGGVATPVLIVAAIVSFSDASSADVVYVLGFGACAPASVWSFERLMRRSNVAAPPRIVVCAPILLLLVFIAVLWAGVSVLDVLVGTPLFPILAAEIASVLVWAVGVSWAISRDVSGRNGARAVR